MSAPSALLQVEGVGKTYEPPPALLRPLIRTASAEPVEALRDVSIDVDAGQIVGLVGQNGAGKTTLVKIITTLLQASSGRVRLRGQEVGVHAVETRRQIGLVLADDRGLYWRLTGRQNLELFGVLAGLPRPAARARAGELLERLGLADRDKRVFGYSTGMRLLLNLARALIAEPALLVLDEPTRSLDPLATEQVGALLRSLAGEGTAVLLSSHRLDEVVATCDRVVALLDGQVRFDGSLEDLDGGHGQRADALARLIGVDEP